MCRPRYKSLVGMRELPAANGENCVIMLSKLCLLRPGAYHVGVTKVRDLLVFICVYKEVKKSATQSDNTYVCVADVSEGGHLPTVGE